MREPIEQMLAALDAHGCDPRRAGAGWAARCPAHDDRRASLSVAAGDNGGAVVHCHAGCEPSAVVAALGLRLSDLMPNNGKTGRKTPHAGRPSPKPAPSNGQSYPTAEAAIGTFAKQFGGRPPDQRWDYHDAAGDVVGAVLRWNQPDGSKAIRPLRRNLDGTWAIGALSEPRPLYRLPAVLAAGAETPVVAAEGEKTVDAAWQCGLVATTSAGGARAARKTDWSPLRGRRVVILPDNDEPGEQYAEDVAQLVLVAGAREVRVLRLVDFAKELPVGGDLADVLESPTWCGLPLADGAGLADVGQWILATAESIEPWRPSQPPNPWRGNPTRRKFCRNLFGNSWK